MKKIFALSAAIMFSTGLVFASIGENNTSDVKVLRAQGFSESMLRVTDTVKFFNQGVSNNYKRQFIKNENPSPYTRAKLYLDPIQDDDIFAEHQINFANTWNGDETHYTTTKVEKGSAQRL